MTSHRLEEMKIFSPIIFHPIFSLRIKNILRFDLIVFHKIGTNVINTNSS